MSQKQSHPSTASPPNSVTRAKGDVDLLLPEVVEQHLAGFAEAFIDRRFRARWLHILIERPTKAALELKRFERHCDPRYCHLLEPGHVDAVSLANELGAVSGCFYDGGGEPCWLGLAEAVTAAAGRDALFSIAPAKVAVFFFHEGWAWICRRTG